MEDEGVQRQGDPDGLHYQFPAGGFVRGGAVVWSGVKWSGVRLQRQNPHLPLMPHPRGRSILTAAFRLLEEGDEGMDGVGGEGGVGEP